MQREHPHGVVDSIAAPDTWFGRSVTGDFERDAAAALAANLVGARRLQRCWKPGRLILDPAVGHLRPGQLPERDRLATTKTYTRAAGKNGHFLLNDPNLWSADLADYVDQVAP